MTSAELVAAVKLMPPGAVAAYIATLTAEQKVQLHQAMEDQRYVDARTDFNIFAELVCRDDESGEPIKQAAIHRRWYQLWSTYKQLIIWSHIASGKSTQLSILRTVFRLGQDPRKRIVILSATQLLARKIVQAIASYIEHNKAVARIFPHLRPDPAGPWSQTELKVVRDGEAKDPSVFAVGVGGSLIGARADDLILDDILTPENTATADQRAKVLHWVQAVAFGRLASNPTILVVGTAFRPDDLLHILALQKGFQSFRFPILDAKGRSTWPSNWPMERIEATRDRLGPAEFARQMLCRARNDDEARFKMEWIDEALRKGRGIDFVQALDEIPDGCGVFTGVDLAISKRKKADKTAFFTFKEDDKGNRTILKIEAGKFQGPDIVDKIVDHHDRYGSVVAVENNAAQDFILQFARDISNVPVVPHTTGKMKHDPILGVESLAIELANGKWIFPNAGGHRDPELEAFITEMLFYVAGAHTGDRLMACYFARDVARKMMGTRGGAPAVALRIVGAAPEEASGAAESKGELHRLFDLPVAGPEMPPPSPFKQKDIST